MSDVMFHIVIPGRNHSQWIGKNLDVLINQTHKDWKAIVMIDGETKDNDEVYEIAKRYTKRDDRLSVCYEPERRWGLENIINGFMFLGALDSHPNDVLMEIDGDDWLNGTTVLENLAKLYEDPDIWLTYGSHKRTTGQEVRCKPYPDRIWERKSHRAYPWWASQLRTFRRFLWDSIKDEDLRDENGNYFKNGWDISFMMPMLDMCEQHNVVAVQDLIYTYNIHQNCNFMLDNGESQRANEWLIRGREKYPYYKDMDVPSP